MYKSTPITAKAKRSPYKADETLIAGARSLGQSTNTNKEKDPEDGAKIYTEGKKNTRVVTGDEITRNKTYQDMIDEGDGDKVDAAIAFNKDLKNKDIPRIQVGTGKFKKETIETTTPGAVADLKVAIKGDVLQPWEKRQQSRSIKKEQKDVRRSKIREAKIQKRLNKANSGSIREARLKAKLEENTARKEEFTNASTRGKAARASGKRTGTSNVTIGERNMLKSEVGKNPASELAQQNQLEKTNAYNATIATSGSKSQGDASITPTENAFANARSKLDSMPEFQYDTSKLGTYNTATNLPAFQSSRTALKKGYFKNK
tara:strand:+ start:3685 stop:4635 length:951 start_codon:yes stop_codon:yes gene_type:complete